MLHILLKKQQMQNRVGKQLSNCNCKRYSLQTGYINCSDSSLLPAFFLESAPEGALTAHCTLTAHTESNPSISAAAKSRSCSAAGGAHDACPSPAVPGGCCTPARPQRRPVRAGPAQVSSTARPAAQPPSHRYEPSLLYLAQN